MLGAVGGDAMTAGNAGGLGGIAGAPMLMVAIWLRMGVMSARCAGGGAIGGVGGDCGGSGGGFWAMKMGRRWNSMRLQLCWWHKLRS